MKDIPIRSIQGSEEHSYFFEGFRIRDLDTVLGGNDLSHDLHRHDFYFVLMITKGRGDHEIDFKEYKISSNSMFFLRPGQVHRLNLKAGSQGYLMEFNRNFYLTLQGLTSSQSRKLASINHYEFDLATRERMQNTMRAIHEEFTSKRQGFQDVIKAQASILFIELSRNQKNADESSGKQTEYAQERFEEFTDLLDTHIFTEKQVSSYAGMLNLSVFQLNSITKKLVGKSAAELIDERIVLESKRYLLATSNQVNQIAYHLGYEDVSYFIRFFKKHTGYTPELFRQNFQ